MRVRNSLDDVARDIWATLGGGDGRAAVYALVHIAKSGGSTVARRLNYLAGGALTTSQQALDHEPSLRVCMRIRAF